MPPCGQIGLVRGQMVVQMPLHTAHGLIQLIQKIHKAQAAVQSRKFVGIGKKPPDLFGIVLRVPAPYHLVEAEATLRSSLKYLLSNEAASTARTSWAATVIVELRCLSRMEQPSRQARNRCGNNIPLVPHAQNGVEQHVHPLGPCPKMVAATPRAQQGMAARIQRCMGSGQSSAAISRSLNFWILPLAVSGKPVTVVMYLGILNHETLPRQ